MVCATIYLDLGIQPELIMPSRARKLVNVKIDKKCGIKEKEQTLQYVKSMNWISESQWKYKKTGKPKDYMYDMVDSLIIAIAGVRQNAKP